MNVAALKEAPPTKTASHKETPPRFPYFTEEHERLRQKVKRFCEEEIAPFAEAWDNAGEFPRELFNKAGDLGLFGLRIDPRWGGSGLDWWATAAYIDAMAYSDSGGVNMGLYVQSELTIPAIALLGSEEQKEEVLRAAIRGDWILSLGITEPEAGSDVAAIQTRARLDGKDLIISGRKKFITNGTRADLILLAVRTGDEGHKGISFVLFPTKTKGFTVAKKLNKVGMLASDTAELHFNECRIPQRSILGEMNKGFYYVMQNFQGERLAAALGAIAGMDRAMACALEYAHQRKAFGSPIGQFQVWRHRFAEHFARIEAGRWLVYRALDLLNRGEPALQEVTMAKLYTTELSQEVLYDCMQVYGGQGYLTECPIGRHWRDVRLKTIGGGSSEIMKEILAKEKGIG
jgi:alkylation response protein AidB-like acyl-CoA dehydrogenase